jgi:hypothetical protein
VDIAQEMPRSAVSNRLLSDIARDDHGDVEKAATGDPAEPKIAKAGAVKSNAGAVRGSRAKSSTKPAAARRPKRRQKST